MFPSLVLALSLANSVTGPPPFPLRTDPPPKEWKVEQINNGLPYRWEKGVVHVLAWEVIEDDRPHQYTQILVLKKFDQPTEQGGYKWVLAQLYRRPEDEKWPWWGPFRVPPPSPIGEQMPKLTDAQLFGYSFYNELPTDQQIKAFLHETGWTPSLGPHEAIFQSEKRTLTTKLSAGGIDRALWKTSFGRDVPVDLFPELKKGAGDKK